MDTRLPPPDEGSRDPEEASPDAESEMSFPASDPPSYSQPTVGDADRAAPTLLAPPDAITSAPPDEARTRDEGSSRDPGSS